MLLVDSLDRMRNVSLSFLLLASVAVSSNALAQDRTPGAPPAAPAAPDAEPVPAPPTPAPSPEAAPAPAPAPAPADATVTPRIRLRHDVLTDVIVTGILATSLISWGFLKTSIGIDSCTICDPKGTSNGLDNAFRDGLKLEDGATAATISHIISYGAGPAMGFALTIGVAAADKRIDEAPLNCLLVIQASLAAVIMKEAFTAFIRRERPFVHALEGEERQKALSEGDPLESFPGGHTASIMAITASSAVISTMRGYRLAPLIWIIGSTVATTSMYLRIASDQHYFTDNVAGAVIGGVVGAAVPLIFHRRLGEEPTAATSWLKGAMMTSTAVPGGRTLGLGWAF